MFAYVWPIALAVLSNVMYHVCAKSMPEGVDPFASLTVTYLVGAAASAALYFMLGGRDLWHEYGRLNWVPFVFGVVLLGLEAGFIYAYRAGWPVSAASIVQSSFLAVALILVGALLFKETLTWNKPVGVAVCLVGLIIINLK